MFIFAPILLEIACGAKLAITFPRFPPDTGRQILQLMSGKRKIGVIAMQMPKNFATEMGIESDWSSTVEGAVTNAFMQKGYYEFVDLAGRKQRLSELAYTQSGMTGEQRTIGQELAVDGLLYIMMTAQPRQECKIENEVSLAGAASTLYNVYAATQGKDQIRGADASSPTGVLYLTVFVQAKLTNLETGQSLPISINKPFRQANDTGNQECPSSLLAFEGALRQAADEIASKLSPEMITKQVSIERDASDLPDPVKDRVKEYLAVGYKWAKNKDYESAAENWTSALNESGGTSVSALWNLAIYKWSTGDMDGAEEMFKRAMKAGGPDFFDDEKSELLSAFKEEKKLQAAGGR